MRQFNSLELDDRAKRRENEPDLDGLVDHQSLPHLPDLALVGLLPSVHSSLILLASLHGLGRRLVPPELFELKNELVQALESDESLSSSERSSAVGLLRDLGGAREKGKTNQIAKPEGQETRGNEKTHSRLLRFSFGSCRRRQKVTSLKHRSRSSLVRSKRDLSEGSFESS